MKTAVGGGASTVLMHTRLPGQQRGAEPVDELRRARDEAAPRLRDAEVGELEDAKVDPHVCLRHAR